jgi:small-conductance mechanosensitive channel
MNRAFEYAVGSNTIGHWLVALLLVGVAFAAFRLLRGFAATQFTRLVAARAPGWDAAVADLVRRTHTVLLAAVSVLIGSQALALSEGVRRALLRALAIALLIQGGIWATTLVGFYVQRYHDRKLKADPSRVTTVQVVGFLVRIGLWCLVALLVLANLGVEITPLLAGLGVGGIAVALAVQTVLKDLLASLSIMLDKPFVIGDFLNLGTEMGTVEYIGLRTTRLRSTSGEQLVLSNADLLESRIRNFGRMRERRIVFTLGVTYATPRAKLVRIPQLVREAIEAQKLTRCDRCHFKAYGDFSLNFETVFFVGVPDYNTYMDIQQAINLRIHELFEQEGIEFAFPTQTLYVIAPGAAPATPATPRPG